MKVEPVSAVASALAKADKKAAAPDEDVFDLEPGHSAVRLVWKDPSGTQRAWEGILRVPTPGELMVASRAWAETFPGLPFSSVPPEVRDHLWPVMKMAPQLMSQPGGKELVAAAEADPYIALALAQEVMRLRAEIFPERLGTSGESAETPRVVLTTRGSSSNASVSAAR